MITYICMKILSQTGKIEIFIGFAPKTVEFVTQKRKDIYYDARK